MQNCERPVIIIVASNDDEARLGLARAHSYRFSSYSDDGRIRFCFECVSSSASQASQPSDALEMSISLPIDELFQSARPLLGR